MTSMRSRVDPEALQALDQALTLGLVGSAWSDDVEERRSFFLDMQATGLDADPLLGRIEQRDEIIVGPDGDELRVQVTRPVGVSGILPAVLCLHGGGFVIGSVETDQAQVRPLAVELGAIVVGVDYRRAPEHPHPAPVEDCHAALAWMVANAEDLQLDPSRIALFGTSAGGGLAAGLALMARDRGTAAPVLQVLAYPMLDDRGTTPSSRDLPALGLWDRDINFSSWALLLGGRAGGPDVDAYAAPARAPEVAGLCPAFLEVGELDILRDETIHYALRLFGANVATELHVHPGAFHACEQVAAGSAIGRRIWQLRIDALRRAL